MLKNASGIYNYESNVRHNLHYNDQEVVASDGRHFDRIELSWTGSIWHVALRTYECLGCFTNGADATSGSTKAEAIDNAIAWIKKYTNYIKEPVVEFTCTVEGGEPEVLRATLIESAEQLSEILATA
jgi:hypothetical protein